MRRKGRRTDEGRGKKDKGWGKEEKRSGRERWVRVVETRQRGRGGGAGAKIPGKMLKEASLIEFSY